MGGALAFLGIILFGGCSYALSSCQEGSRRLVKGTQCSAYEECKFGGFVLQKCNSGYLFHEESEACREHSEVTCTDDAPQCEEGAIFANPSTCYLYYKCEGNRVTTKFCPAGTSFDPIAQSCRNGISCEEPGFTGESMSTIENNNFECAEDDARPLRCREYNQCKGGKWSVRNCALGEIFDESTKQCKPGACVQRSKRSVDSCIEGRRRRIDGTCNQYTECVNGEEVQKNCSLCMNFDDLTLSCRYFFRYPCPNPPPPVPTDPPTPEPTTPEPTTPEPTTPEPTTPEPTTPEPTTPEPTTPEPTTPEPTTPEPPTPEPTTPEPPTPEPTTPEPTTPEPTTPEPPTPEPTTPEPPTPEPTTLEPTTPEPTTPEPTTPQPTSSESFDVRDLAVKSKNNEPCKEGDRKIIPGNCKEYLQCVYGRYFKDSCNIFQHFDVNSMECAVFWYTCP